MSGTQKKKTTKNIKKTPARVPNIPGKGLFCGCFGRKDETTNLSMVDKSLKKDNQSSVLTTSNFESNLASKTQTLNGTPMKAQTYRDIRTKYVVTEELPCEEIPEFPGKKATTPSLNMNIKNVFKNDNTETIEVPNIQKKIRYSHKKTNSLMSDRPIKEELREKINLINENLIFESQLTEPKDIFGSIREVNKEPELTQSLNTFNQKIDVTQKNAQPKVSKAQNKEGLDQIKTKVNQNGQKLEKEILLNNKDTITKVQKESNTSKNFVNINKIETIDDKSLFMRKNVVLSESSITLSKREVETKANENLKKVEDTSKITVEVTKTENLKKDVTNSKNLISKNQENSEKVSEPKTTDTQNTNPKTETRNVQQTLITSEFAISHTENIQDSKTDEPKKDSILKNSKDSSIFVQENGKIETPKTSKSIQFIEIGPNDIPPLNIPILPKRSSKNKGRNKQRTSKGDSPIENILESVNSTQNGDQICTQCDSNEIIYDTPPKMFKKDTIGVTKLGDLRSSLIIQQNSDQKYVLNIRKHYHVNFGTGLYVHGNIEELGNNDRSKAVKLEWTEGDIWIGSIELNSVPEDKLSSGYQIEYNFCENTYDYPDMQRGRLSLSEVRNIKENVSLVRSTVN